MLTGQDLPEDGPLAVTGARVGLEVYRAKFDEQAQQRIARLSALALAVSGLAGCRAVGVTSRSTDNPDAGAAR